MIIFDGQIVGAWKRKVHKHSIDVDYDLFIPLNEKQRSLLINAMHRLYEFTGIPVSYTNNRLIDNT